MSQEPPLALSLQQDLLTLLCHDDQNGKVVSKTVDATYFEGDYRVIADRALTFWRQHKVAPKLHIADLLSDILEDDADRRGKTYRRILVSMMEMKDKINVDFVLRSMNQFIRMQRTKAIILEAAEQLDIRGISGLEDIENLLHRFLRDKHSVVEHGLRLNDFDKMLAYLENNHSEFKTGIKDLDAANIVPMRGKLFLAIASTGRGKTWLLIQLGKMAFLQRKKVLHVSLEIEAEEVLQRYYQALFGASKKEDLNKISTLKFTKEGNLDQIVSQSVAVPFTFKSGAIREEIRTRTEHFGSRSSNFIIKRFAMSTLTIEQYDAYLGYLEAVEGFVPDLVLLDYPKIMKFDSKDLRVSLGRLVENLRGIAQQRNHALAAVHQGSKLSADADLVKATHVSEDWSIIGTSDIVVTYSQTAAEGRLGLARLFVDKARSEQDKFGVLITQSYKTGQFVLESTRLSDHYARIMESMPTSNDDDEDYNDD
jgi:replicative DNA helicase